jgi:1-acyl-sn-glycerol-3-phosphate acyltransferase
MLLDTARSVALLFHTLGCSLAALAGEVVRPGRGVPGRVMDWWGRRFPALGGWRVEAGGLENLPPGGAVLVSNHQSLADIPLFLSVVPGEVRFLAKRELGRIPLFGRALAGSGNLLVDRADPRDGAHLLAEASRRLSGGLRLVVFPEGTRSRDGVVGPFKGGAFLLAKRASVPVVPVRIDGGREALPKGSYRFRPARLSLVVLPPLDPSLSPAGMAEAARAAIVAEGLRNGRGCSPAASPPVSGTL